MDNNTGLILSSNDILPANQVLADNGDPWRINSGDKVEIKGVPFLYPRGEKEQAHPQGGQEAGERKRNPKIILYRLLTL